MNVKNRNKQWLRLLGTSLLSASFLFSQQSFAQAEGDENDEEVVDEVTVTGSRIKRADNLSSPVPMVSMGEQQIELTGSINVYDIFFRCFFLRLCTTCLRGIKSHFRRIKISTGLPLTFICFLSNLMKYLLQFIST